MFRRLSLALAIAAALAPMQAYPLGLGEIHPKSYLNQAFSADIDLLSVDPDDLDGVKVGLASPEAFKKAGIERPFFLSRLKFTPVATPDGKTIIRVNSSDLVREPFLDFLIEVNWPKGRIVREYTVLLDPPVVSQRRPRPVSAPQVAARPASASKAQPAAVAPTGALEYGPTRPNDTLWGIAKGMRVQGASTEQVLMALYRHNPDAFINNNVNLLKVGQVLRLPSADAAKKQTRSEARAELRAQTEAWRAEGQPAKPAAEPEEMEEAPTPATTAEAPTEAPASEAPKPAAETEAAAPAEPKPSSEPELKLVSADTSMNESSTSEGVAGETESAPEGGGDVQRLEQDLLLAREETAVARQDAIGVKDRIGELEGQLEKMRRLMEVQNDRLARLQEQAEEAAAKPSAPPQPPPPKGFVERVAAGDPVVVGLLGAAGGLLLALVIGLLMGRRKREEAAFTSPAPRPAPVRSAAPAASGSQQTAALAAAAAAVAGTTVATPTPSVPEEEPALDPMAEVDVYIAYGRYEQAQEMLEHEIARHPERLDFQFKLLEVFAEAGKGDAYVAQAEKMSRAGADAEDPDAWDRAMEVGRSLAPGAALFGGAESAAETGVSPAPASDFDIDLEDMVTSGEEPVEAAQEADDLDFDLADYDIATGEHTATEPEDLSVAAPVAEPGAMTDDLAVAGPEEFDEIDLNMEPAELDDEPDDISLDEVGGLLETAAPAPPPEPELPEELSLDIAAGAGSDEEEVETKIDLARAYQDMGDPDDARVILEEVLREGNEEQKQRARALLQEIS